MSEDKARAVPLIERLRKVPKHARHAEDWPASKGLGTSYYPTGALCHEAADALAQHQTERDSVAVQRPVLPPLPPRVEMGMVWDSVMRYHIAHGYTAEQMEEYARSAIAASGRHADARSSVKHSGQEQDAKDAAPTASEAVYAFAGWVTTRPGTLVAGATHGAAEWADAVEQFCATQGWEAPRSDYADKITPYKHDAAIHTQGTSAQAGTEGEPILRAALASKQAEPIEPTLSLMRANQEVLRWLIDAAASALSQSSEPSQQQTAVRVTCSFKTESGNFGDEIARCQVCGAHRGSPSAENCVNRAAAERSKPAPEAPEPDEKTGVGSGEQDAKDAAPDWHAHGMAWALADACDPRNDTGDEMWTTDDIARAFAAGASAALSAVDPWAKAEARLRAAIHTQGTEG